MSGIFYKNRPYVGGGGGAGGASALSDLTDTNISSPTNGQVLKYNNGFWENDDESGGTTVVANPTGTASAQLNKLQVGNTIYSIPSGGGGGGITYGYTNPTGSASDGALYILLNQNNTKRGEYLYITNVWVLIDGQPPFDGSIYDEGAEGVELGLYQATKEATYIEINNGGGYLNYYTNTVNKIDVTDFDELYCKYQFNGTEYEQTVDISSYTGEKYIMFHYFSGAGFNNCAVSITDELYTSTTFPATDVIELTRSLVENTVKTKVRKMILR